MTLEKALQWAEKNCTPETVRRLRSRDVVATLAAEVMRTRAAALKEIERLRDTLAYAEAALADIGDADREPGDDLAWCEARAAEALPRVRSALKA